MSKGTLVKITETKSISTLKKIWLKNSYTNFSSLVFSHDDSLIVAVERDSGKAYFKCWNEEEKTSKKTDSILSMLNRQKEDFKVATNLTNA